MATDFMGIPIVMSDTIPANRIVLIKRNDRTVRIECGDFETVVDALERTIMRVPVSYRVEVISAEEVDYDVLCDVR